MSFEKDFYSENNFINLNQENKKKSGLTKEEIQEQAISIYNSIVIQNPYFNQEIVDNIDYLYDKTIVYKRMNGFMLYMTILKDHFWVLNPNIKRRQIQIATNALLWKALSADDKEQFKQRAVEINLNYKKLNHSEKTTRISIV